eukprot:3938957-Heterocapsa_arctica.AAC.1
MSELKPDFETYAANHPDTSSVCDLMMYCFTDLIDNNNSEHTTDDGHSSTSQPASWRHSRANKNTKGNKREIS